MHKYSSLALIIVMLQSCSYLPELPDLPEMPDIIPSISLPEGYRKNVIQGSEITLEEVQKLKVGMSKNDVINLLGSPTIIDPFHPNQWEYINHSINFDKPNTKYRITVKLTDGVVSSFSTHESGNIPKKNQFSIENEKKIESDKDNPWYKFW